jgi:hypothetical protein
MKLLMSLLLILSWSAHSNPDDKQQQKVDRANFIPVYVEPFYSGPKSPGSAPERVKTHPAFDGKMMSTKKEDILAVRDAILKDNGTVTPMTLFTLSARLFDVGEKEEAVFWFYAARDRYRIVEAVGDQQVLAQAIEASNAFNQLMGPFINGYAFCNIDKQVESLKRAAEWTANNPYKALLMPQIPSPHADREKVMKEKAADRMAQALKNEAYFKDQKKRDELAEGRKKNSMTEKYCF